MSEISGSPMSMHDFDVLRSEIIGAHCAGTLVREVIVSSRRVKEPFKAFGIDVRVNDELPLNIGLLLLDGREPQPFDFEELDA